MTKKTFKKKELLWAFYSLIIALLIHFLAPGYMFVQFFKYVAIFGVITNVCSAFNIRIPYISEKKK